MPRLKRLTSREIVRFLGNFGFEVVSVRGSHAKLVRQAPGEKGVRKQILVVPIHRRISVGTIHAVYRQASRFIPEDDLRPGFFTD